jgi:hypothetical protein
MSKRHWPLEVSILSRVTRVKVKTVRVERSSFAAMTCQFITTQTRGRRVIATAKPTLVGMVAVGEMVGGVWAVTVQPGEARDRGGNGVIFLTVDAIRGGGA